MKSYARAMEIKVENTPEEVDPYVVARPDGGSLWYWGSWNNKEEAQKVAKEIGGLVLFCKER